MKIGRIGDWIFSEAGYKMQLGNKLLKPMQIAIINCNKSHDVLVNLPTGFGKSMLYQYPASQLYRSCIVVFVPLRALLWDSIRQAALLNILAKEAASDTINSYFTNNQLPQLLFLTPEKLFQNHQTMRFIQTLYDRSLIDKFVIDEAHCISEWGNDFRPDYLQLMKLRELFPGPRILAMSATIPIEARIDLTTKAGINNCYYFQSSYHRPNLHYQIWKTQKKNIVKEIDRYMSQRNLNNSFGIIYCQTIILAETVYKQLNQIQPNCQLFHSKISQKKRKTIFDSFKNGITRIIVATICFGMGINKPDVRFVINVGVSKSVENYYQESGRAGRDGQQSYCLLLTYPQDQNPLVFLTQKSTGTLQIKNRMIYKITQIKNYTESQQCRRVNLFAKLGEIFSVDSCGKKCDICLSSGEFEQIDYTQKGLFILKELAKHKKRFTKIQLASYLKGMSNSNKIEFAAEVKGILKKQPIEHVNTLIDRFISLGSLIVIIVRRKRGFITKYLKTAKISIIRQINSIKIRIKKDRKKVIIYKSDKSDKFNKYMEKKKGINNNILNQPIKQKLIIDTIQQPIQQAKIIMVDDQLEKFLEDLLEQNKNVIGLEQSDHQETKVTKQEDFDQIPQPTLLQTTQELQQIKVKQFPQIGIKRKFEIEQ